MQETGHFRIHADMLPWMTVLPILSENPHGRHSNDRGDFAPKGFRLQSLPEIHSPDRREGYWFPESSGASNRTSK